MHPDVDKLIEAGRISEEQGKKINAVSPGSFVKHKVWGAGKVASWNLSGGKVVIDFEQQQGQEMGLKFAIEKTQPLEEGGFAAQKVNQLDELKVLAVEDPIELVRRTIEAAGGGMTADQLERELSGSVVDKEKYKKWWESTKKQLRAERAAVVPPRRTETITMRDPNESPADTLIADYHAAGSLQSKLKAFDAIQSDPVLFEDKIEELHAVLEDVENAAKKSMKLKLADSLNLLACRDELVANVEGLELTDSSFRLTDVLTMEGTKVASAVGDIPVARQTLLFESYPAAYGDNWVDEILRALESTGGRGVAEIAKLLQAEGKLDALEEHLTKIIASRSATPDVLIWITREREGLAKGVFSLETGTAILNAIERDVIDDGPRRASRLQGVLLEDKELITDLVEGAEEIEVRHFGKRLMSNPVYADLDKKSLMARVLKTRPEVQDIVTGENNESEDESFVSSWASIEKRKKELEDIVHNQIPQNRKDIQVAKAHGDLRENFEYHAAKQQQAVLMRKQGLYEKDLMNVRGTDFSEGNTDFVNPGNIVTLEGPNGEVTYTLLGAWDSEPEKNILSYLSEIGIALIGKSVGDTVEIIDLKTEQPTQMKITKIEMYKA